MLQNEKENNLPGYQFGNHWLKAPNAARLFWAILSGAAWPAVGQLEVFFFNHRNLGTGFPASFLHVFCD